MGKWRTSKKYIQSIFSGVYKYIKICANFMSKRSDCGRSNPGNFFFKAMRQIDQFNEGTELSSKILHALWIKPPKNITLLEELACKILVIVVAKCTLSVFCLPIICRFVLAQLLKSGEVKE